MFRLKKFAQFWHSCKTVPVSRGNVLVTTSTGVLRKMSRGVASRRFVDTDGKSAELKDENFKPTRI